MGLTVKVEVRDANVLARLNELSTVFIPQEQEDAIGDILRASIAQAQEYPPTTEANNPPPPYYMRGVGYWSKYNFTDTPSKPSEQLDLRWEYKVDVDEYGATGFVRNRVSYAGYVQDEDWQVTWHKKTGWVPMQDIIRSQMGEATDSPSKGAANRLKQMVTRIANRWRR